MCNTTEPYPPVIDACDYCGIFTYVIFLETKEGVTASCNGCWENIQMTQFNSKACNANPTQRPYN